MNEIQKAKFLIENSNSIAILPSFSSKEDEFAAALALFYSLKQANKNVNLTTTTLPSTFRFLVKKDVELYSSTTEFLISIKEKGAKLSQLYYEKTEEGLNLYLKTENGALKKENLSFYPLVQSDVLVAVGIKKRDIIKQVIKKSDSVLINIDNKEDNERYGEANLINPCSSSLSEIVLDFLSSFSEKILTQPLVLTSLLAGTIQGALSGKNRPDLTTLEKLKFLIKQGADFERVFSNSWPNEEKSKLLLLSKIIKNTELDKSKKTIWTTLTKEDFINTKSTPHDISFSLRYLTSIPSTLFIVLWEAWSFPLLTKGVAYSKDKKLLEIISDTFEAQRKENALLFKSEKDLRATREKLKAISDKYLSLQ